MSDAAPSKVARPGAVLILIPLAVGCVVSLALGVYGKVHDPTGKAIFTLGFSGMINMKVWLATIAAVLGLYQVVSAARMYGVFGTGSTPGWAKLGHRASGAAAV